MKLNKKVKRVGVISGILLVGLIGIGKAFNIPVLSTGVNYVLYPLEKGIYLFTDTIGGICERFQKVDELIAENEALKEEVVELRTKQELADRISDDLERLRSALDMKEVYADYNGIGANVIARDYGNWNKVYRIDVGTNKNVKDKSVVLADGGLVGHVEEPDNTSSKVITLIDSRSYVSVEVSRTGDVGMLRGDIELANDGLCLLEINGEAEIVKNDQIITSYLSDVYPPGILVGKVEEVQVNSNDLVTYAWIRPVVDFDHLKQVLVINSKEEQEE
ncbi:MAG: rod shape-determining protein MreC [Cellulosilyticum sp.]|nr:rod shape-determining protein MreC [Cellulosilyticum sp.]